MVPTCAVVILGVIGLSGCANMGVASANATGSVSRVNAVDAPAVEVYSAGSLRDALTEIARDHEARTGQRIKLTFGASGLLRERIEKGEPAQVFASADTAHPQRLANGGGWLAPTVFVRNVMCALTSDQVNATPANMLATLLDPQLRVGTSTPLADPSGDYAWALFRKADSVQPGAYAVLDAKALKLVGGAGSPQPPAGRSAYAWMMERRQADVFIVYCTNAMASQKEMPPLKVVQMPPQLQVSAAYGATVRTDAPAAAAAFSQALLAAPAQAVFRRFGFGAP